MRRTWLRLALPHVRVIEGLLERHVMPLVKLNSAPAAMMAFTDVTGANEAIVALGDRGYGPPAERKVTPNDLIHIGSCSKAVTSTAILNYIDVVAASAPDATNGTSDGASALPRLTRESTLKDYLPPDLVGVNPQLESATLQQLLDHRSGFIDWRQAYGINPRRPGTVTRVLKDYVAGGCSTFALMQQRLWRPWLDIDVPLPLNTPGPNAATLIPDAAWAATTRHAPLLALLRSPTVTEFDRIVFPGTQWKYSNVGYALAAYMAERASGVSWERLVTDYVFAPLRMRSAGFGEPTARIARLRDDPNFEAAVARVVAAATGRDNYAGRDADARGAAAAADPRTELAFETSAAPASHTAHGVFGGKHLPEEVPRGHRSFVPAMLAPAGDVSMTMKDWLRFMRYHLDVVRTDKTFVESQGTILPPAYDPGDAAAIRGAISYKSGWIVDKSQAAARMRRADNTHAASSAASGLSWQAMAKRLTGRVPGEGAAAAALPLNLSHDGSHAGQYCYCLLFPKEGYAAAIWTNSVTLATFGTATAALREALKDIDPELTEAGRKANTERKLGVRQR